MIKENELYYYDSEAGEGFINAIETLCHHVKGDWAAGSNTLMKLEEWQKEEIIRPLFGVKQKKLTITKTNPEGKNLRRYKTAYIELPKKNGKSALMSAIIAIFQKAVQDPGAEIYSVATTRDQAKIIFTDVCRIINKNNFFKKQGFKVYQNAITCGGKSYRALSADVGPNDGVNSNLIVFDELHRQKNRDLYDVLVGSTTTKDESLFIMITTAGSDLNSICYEMHDYAIKVRDGIIKDDTFLPVIYAADLEDDPFVEATWKKANPNYGISVNAENLARLAEKARTNKAYLNTFLRLHLNIWTNVSEVWITDDKWQKCGAAYGIDDSIGQTCYGGLDLSSKSDITAFTLIFPPQERDFEPEKYLTLNWFWLPEEKGKDSADKNNNNYLKWLNDGWIEETSGNVIDYDYIEKRILDICEKFNVAQFAYDPYNSTQIVAKLEEQGLPMIPFRQGFVSMNFPTLEFEVKINRGEFLHNNNPVLRWMVSNGVLLSDTGGKLFKVGKNQPNQKIDGLITNIMALGLAIDGNDEQGSYLDTNDVMYVDL